MTKRGEGDWGQHLLHSKMLSQNIVPKSSTKRGNLSQMQWREKGAGGSISATQNITSSKEAGGSISITQNIISSKVGSSISITQNIITSKDQKGLGAASPIPKILSQKVQQKGGTFHKCSGGRRGWGQHLFHAKKFNNKKGASFINKGA